jgi:hypothetical protein
MTAFWDVAPCSLVEVDRRFRGFISLMKAVRASQTSVYFYETNGATSQKAIIFILAAVRT